MHIKPAQNSIEAAYYQRRNRQADVAQPWRNRLQCGAASMLTIDSSQIATAWRTEKRPQLQTGYAISIR
jgi:hypothetical protein